MDNPTIPNHFPRLVQKRHAAPPSRTATHPDHDVALVRVWLVVNLAAVAAVGAFSGIGAIAPLGPVWASFTVINALIIAFSRGRGWLPRLFARTPLLLPALAGAAGFGWGGGIAAMLPHLDGGGLTVALSAAFTVSLVAIPTFSDERRVFYVFSLPLALTACVAIAFDGRFSTSIIWLLLGGGCLLMLSTAYYRTQRRLRMELADLLAPLSESGVIPDPSLLRADDLSRLTQRSLDTLQSLFARNERKRRILTALGDALISTDANGLIEYVNPVAEVLLGWSAAELRGRPLENGLRIVFPPDQRNQIRAIFDHTRTTRRSQRSDEQSQLLRRDGVVYGIDYMVNPIRDQAGEFAGAAFTLRDVTEKRHRAETIEWQASHDPLTKAVNRTEFEIRVKKLLRQVQDNDGDVHALLFIDIDNFKFINDSYGHAAGDALLKTLADVLRTRIRGADTLGRIGGDEFSALLYSCSGEKARLIAEGLRIAVDRHEFKWHAINLPLSLSIGIVEINEQHKSVASIMRAADAACYTAKKYGRNRVQIYSPAESGEQSQSRVFDFVKDIQTAIQGNRLELFYQPIMATNGEATAQCELSVGVRQDDGELMPRSELQALAARYHLTEEIDRWLIKATIDALSLSHPVLHEMSLVLIPLSQQTVADERMLEYIDQLLDEEPALAPRIGFAMDNPEFVSDLESMRYFVNTLKVRGCRFLLGDFAFDNRALETVKSLQPEFLGISAKLVQAMPQSSVDYEIVLGLSRIAHTLGMHTVAAGANTQALRDALGAMGVDFTSGDLHIAPRRVAVASEAQWI